VNEAVQNRVVKILVVTIIFPILVVAFHFLLMIPAIFVGSLLTHFAGHPEFWGKALSVLALLPACWGAFVVCKLAWPGSKQPTASPPPA